MKQWIIILVSVTVMADFVAINMILTDEDIRRIRTVTTTLTLDVQAHVSIFSEFDGGAQNPLEHEWQAFQAPLTTPAEMRKPRRMLSNSSYFYTLLRS